jgi:hypothetical protein
MPFAPFLAGGLITIAGCQTAGNSSVYDLLLLF